MRVGVVGAGPMGRLHVRTVHAAADRAGDFRLARVFDRHMGRAAALAGEFGAHASEDLARFAAEVDAAVVAVPTRSHFDVSRRLLEGGVDLLVEKPLAMNVAEAEELVDLARRAGSILQVGHVEWYNPSWRQAASRVGELRRIEVERFQRPSRRGLDIDVVNDLMLHDLDWVSRWIAKPVAEIRAENVQRVEARVEAVDVELGFEGGCIATLRASRIHTCLRRMVRFEGERETATVSLANADAREEASNVPVTPDRDPLACQWDDFIDACRSRASPVNDGNVGLAALRLVEEVHDAIDRASREPRPERGVHEPGVAS